MTTKNRNTSPTHNNPVDAEDVIIPGGGNNTKQAYRPVHVVKMSPFQVSIWSNSGKDGRTFFTCAPTRSFMQDNEWKKSTTCSQNNIAILIAALKDAQEWMDKAQRLYNADAGNSQEGQG